MKCKIPEISWHNRDPVLSVDIQPKNEFAVDGNMNRTYRLASGGTDAHVLIWYITLAADGSDIDLDLAADLARHQRAVNVVKWSPNSELLASGDDESVVFIWKLKAESDPLNILENTNDQDKEVWITMKILRGHMEDIYDLSWSPNSQFLVSGSVDNTAMIWDVRKGKSVSILNDHKGFVQGVAWDPKNQYIATMSTDRYLRIFDIQTKRVLHRIYKGTLPVPEGHELYERRMRFFHDDTLQTFFRRLSFTPDGKLLLTPAGVTDYDGCVHPLHTTYAFSRYALRQPAIVLPCSEQYTVAVRCCPLLYRLRPHNVTTNPPVVPLPYRMIFAVATRSSVYFYDTQQRQPFALISNIHYTRLTDVAWSSDGRMVVVSSTDGFCSLITFESDELGEEYENSAAVLSAALLSDVAPVNSKKSKKQKENDSQQKSLKYSTDEVKVVGHSGGMSREPLLEKVVEKETETLVKESETQKSLSPISIKLKKKVESKPKTEEREARMPKLPTPIAIRRKEKIEKESETCKKEVQKLPTQIAIKRKVVTTQNPKTSEESGAEEIQSSSVDDSVTEGLKEKLNQNHQEAQEQKLATPIAINFKSAGTQSTKTDEGSEPKQNRNITAIADCVAKEEKVATPFAIERKSTTAAGNAKTNDSGTKSNTTVDDQHDKSAFIDKYIEKDQEAKKEQQVATLIAIKRKGTPIKNTETNIQKGIEKVFVSTSSSAAMIVPAKALPTDIILDKEILSSDEKFETPEKKCRPVTPISVRRTPRGSNTASTTNSPKSVALQTTATVENNSPLVSLNSSRQQKKATPIAVRRAPRRALTAPATLTPVLDTPTVGEEAMDAWPLKYDNNDGEEEKKAEHKVVSQNQPKMVNPLEESVPKEFACERTEDIRLVYEDTVEETPLENVETIEVSEKKCFTKTSVAEETPTMKIQPTESSAAAGTTAIVSPHTPNQKQQTPNNKTPRRVALKTISTPKSKKKLL